MPHYVYIIKSLKEDHVENLGIGRFRHKFLANRKRKKIDISNTSCRCPECSDFSITRFRIGASIIEEVQDAQGMHFNRS